MFRNKARLFAASLVLAAASPALAHEAVKGPNGGHVMEVSGYHIEFVPSQTEVTFYLSDQAGKPIASKGTKAKVFVQDGGKTTPLQLTPTDPDKLTAKLAAPLVSGAKVAVTATMPDGHNLQARFVLP
ncbi:hypothetical protein [Hyphomicrobium sp.]|uniref:hypothetical protein n=1 Tax=Hyphomicrobium sp. TaxID=82 RepID=UPI002D76C3E2|nr:hypothetical protein [Hyphomicrobium sp.]HET6387924.1 hypothetical protein [Hyphomicrobium sp.]